MSDLAAAFAHAGAPVTLRNFPAASYRVTRERIREFALAVHDFHPAHWRDSAAAALGFPALIAPPTFGSVILTQAQREILDSLVPGYDPDRILHADQVLDPVRPLVAGDRLTCRAYFESFRHFAAYDVLAIKTVLTDQRGAVVQTGSTALLARTGDGAPGPARQATLNPVRPATLARPVSLRMPRTTVDFDALTVGSELPAQVIDLTRTDLNRYSRVLGGPADRPAVIAPGMLKLGLAAGYLSAWSGDPSAVLRFRAQFAHYTHGLRIPVDTPCPIEFRGRITSKDPRRRKATVALDARAEGRRLFGYAAAEMRFPGAAL
ncbi:MaoC family dehydratase N-terminal domain-containing protein [Nocardia sp. XZ_19_385]|uniref:FAS1-like dehydratase domain-containing protein n=1 Tax=Nocardia sp. XZ_19_385 TaxID=2769488 RepID=UPI0018904017|nr:MaoC family dehydratase N-terminal domain-containing protein [Nocardia sp. XZ_19_385]